MKRLLPLFIALSAVVLFLPRLAAQRQETTGTSAQLARARSIGLNHLRAIASRKRIDRPNDLVVSRTDVDRQARAHTRVQQFHRGVPVLGGEAIAHLNPDGGIFAETDNLVSDLVVDTMPRLTQASAIAIAVADYGCSTCLTVQPEADVWVLRDEFGADHLAFRVQLTRLDGTSQTALPVRFVDAHSGAVVLAYDNLQTGSGPSLYSGTVTIGTSFNGVGAPGHPVGHYMENLVRRVGTFDIRNAIISPPLFRFVDADDIWDAPTQRAAVDAHFGAERFLDYLQSVHGRNGIDGLGGPYATLAHDGLTELISAVVHFGSGYNNAFWDPVRLRMVYGDGDGVEFSPLVSLDIAGHEMMHGVTQFTAGLIFNGESGALNESWSDVFGAMLERDVRGENADTWLIAEQAITPGTPGDALRYMHDPHLAPSFRCGGGGCTADDDPDHYSERYIGPEDNGGVHINSGIPNKAFYLLAKGGSHHLGGSMTGIGADQAARIWFTALTSYMTSSTNFAGARSATMLAAAAIYGSGSTQEQAVSSAWCLVGVGACATVEAISVTPSSGSGVTQAFTLQYSDSLGAADLSAARVRFGASNVDPGTCTASYDATNGVVQLLDDAGTAWVSGTMGGAPLSNSQCTLNLAGSSATPNGNDLTVVLDITFSGSFTGLKQIYMLAQSAGGVSTGWQQRGTWTTNAPTGPYPVSVTPGVGLGSPQSFILQYSDSSGAANLKAVKVRFGAANVNPGTCTARYRPMAGMIDLMNDAGTAWTSWTLETPGGTLSNSQCTLNLAGSAATLSGNDLTVLLNISFNASFVGEKTIFMHAKNASQKSGWLTRGTWTVPVPGPNAASVTPSSGTGLAQAFTLQYSDSAGAANLTSARVRFGASNVGPGTCTARYKPAGGIVELLNNAGTAWASGTIGSGTLANSQCTLNLTASSATPNSGVLTVVLDITFSATFAGQKTIYMLAKNTGGVSTGWQPRGTWTVPTPTLSTGLSFDSQPGDYIGGGTRHLYTPADGTFTITRNANNGVSVSVIGPQNSFWWYMDFSALGDVPLQVGSYGNATRFASTDFVGMDVYGSGRGCNALTGRFKVLEIVYDGSGNVQRFAVDFEQHCEDSDPALFGALRYDSTLSSPLDPFAGAYPSYELRILLAGVGNVSGPGLDCGNGGLMCHRILTSPASLDLTATPNPGSLFGGWMGNCHGGRTIAVNVNTEEDCGALFIPMTSGQPQTLLFWNSQQGDFIGQGDREVYAAGNSLWTFNPWNGAIGLKVRGRGGVRDSEWNLRFEAPTGQQLTPGVYNNAARFGTPTAPAIDVSGNGRGCNATIGRFVVHELTISAGVVTSLSLDFEQHCENQTIPPRPLLGSIRYNSTVAPSVALAVTVVGHGRVTLSPTNTVCTFNCTESYAPGESVHLAAIADPGWVFVSWSGDQDCLDGSLTMSAPASCGATFQPSPLLSTLSRDAGVSGFEQSLRADLRPQKHGL